MNQKILQSIGQNVRFYRKKLSFSQEKLAEMSEMDKTAVSRIESGRINSSVLVLNKIATCLNVTLVELVDEKNEVSKE